MKILVINPNTSTEVTHQIEESLKPYQRTDVELDVVNPERGPPGIESYYHKAIAAVETIKLTQHAEKNQYDAVIIACFSDPGLEGAREVVRIPVVGIGEASVLLAASLGHRFSIIAILKNSIPRAERLVGQLGLTPKLASVREIGMGVVEMEEAKEKGWQRILERCRSAITVDDAEVIVLGCAGMSGLAQKLQRELGVPVIDPTLAAYKIAEVLVDMDLTHSKIALYKGPSVK
ncbi:MAG: aspartate/glutamate racemase family protein [Candidatus Bathyarchaeota archaeon]|nr:MAG: aspartate/glutamate racemase family protein [Candidatus Bathyarchaeota archaeon]